MRTHAAKGENSSSVDHLLLHLIALALALLGLGGSRGLLAFGGGSRGVLHLRVSPLGFLLLLLLLLLRLLLGFLFRFLGLLLGALPRGLLLGGLDGGLAFGLELVLVTLDDGARDEADLLHLRDVDGLGGVLTLVVEPVLQDPVSKKKKATSIDCGDGR